MTSKITTKRLGSVWTRQEVRTLKSIFRNRSTFQVAELLDRTPKAVERKASKLSLTKTKKYLRSLGRKA